MNVLTRYPYMRNEVGTNGYLAIGTDSPVMRELVRHNLLACRAQNRLRAEGRLPIERYVIRRGEGYALVNSAGHTRSSSKRVTGGNKRTRVRDRITP